MFDAIFLLFMDFLLFAQRRTVAPKKSGGALDINTVFMIIIGTAIVATVAVIAYYIVSRLRKSALDSEKPPSMSDHLKAFREAADEGSMTDMEFAVVKKHLSKIIMDEVKQENSPIEPEDDLPKFLPQ